MNTDYPSLAYSEYKSYSSPLFVLSSYVYGTFRGTVTASLPTGKQHNSGDNLILD